MFRTVEAVIDEEGVIRFIEPIKLPPGQKVLVTILDETSRSKPVETSLLSEPSLSDWNRPEEDKAWADLQEAPPFLNPLTGSPANSPERPRPCA